MATFLFFNHPAHGHTNPTLPLVTELVRRGHRVVYYSTEGFQQAIEQTGAIFRDYGEAFPFDATRAPENQFIILLEHLQASSLILGRLLPSIRAEHPDAILYDQLAVWGPYLAQVLNVPTICSFSMFVVTPRMLLSDPAQIRNRIISGSLVRRMRQLSAQISATYHVRNVSLFDLANNQGQLNIVYTSRAFQPDGNSFDDSYTFVGPSLLPRATAPEFPYEKLDSGKPLISISLGTLYNARPEFYRHVLTAFAHSRYQIVLALGHKTPLTTLGDIPANFIVRPFVPQLEILQRAALFITHGGMNSVSEGLYYGVPLLPIPQSADQPWVARRVVQLGAGKMLHRSRVNTHRLSDVAEEILALHSYTQTSARLGNTLRAAGGYVRAVDAVQEFMQHTSTFAAHTPASWQEVFFNKLISMTV
jgi:MGT family glycosyltransferase